MRSKVRLAIIGASVAALAGAVAAPAMAGSVSVTMSTSSGTRTLNLYQPDGTTPLTSSDLSTGASNFIAQVVDSSYSNNGFKVQATMSNLYGFANNTYNCNVSVPSSAINLSSPTGLLSLAGVNANLTPVFTMTGTLLGTLSGGSILGLLNSVPINLPINGLLPGSLSPLSQSQLTGLNATNLIGSTLAGVESKLPVSLGTTGLGGSFTSADAHPSCPGGGVNPTQVQIMNSAADPGGVLAQLQSLIQGVLGTATPTVTQLIGGGFLSSSAVSSALQTVSGLINQLGLGGLTGALSTIEGLLNVNLSSLAISPTSLVQSGNYSSSPNLAVNTAGIPAGTYKGVMTVTLLDQ
jgi:hypothetical protein